MGTKLAEVIGLTWRIRIVPVTNVNDSEFFCADAIRPFNSNIYRSAISIPAYEPQGFFITHVQLIRETFETFQGLNKVIL